MNKSLYKDSKGIVLAMTIVIAVLSYWFWAFPYRAALGYREEMQLFLTTSSYFLEHLAVPGGIAVYAGEYLTQFFNNYWMGGAVMALFMVAFYWICSAACQGRRAASAVALLPVVALWLYMGNPNVTMGFAMALLLVMLPTAFGKITYTWLAVLTALLYWAAGPVTIVFTLLAAIGRFAVEGKTGNKIAFASVAVAWLVLNYFVWSRFVTYPVRYQLIGIGYLLNPDTLDVGQVIVEALCVLSPLAAWGLARLPQKFAVPVTAAAFVASVAVIFPKTYDSTTYDLLNYDYLVRANDWDGILEYSDAHSPELPMSVSATNLALGMTGQLDSRAFDYYQHGAEGMVPPFQKETLSSWTTGEIFWQLGMVNSAQRFYFEGMEAIPNYNKSGRALKRLAETAMVRGEYALAEKYLKILTHTLFYRKWAKRKLWLIGTNGRVESQPVYGIKRAGMVDEDYMFSEGELDKTFGQLFLKDPANNLAKQYLVVWPLLQRDLDKFGQYMGVVAEKYPDYNPLLAQQAMAFMAMRSGQPVPTQIVPAEVEQQLRGFAQAWTSKDPGRIEPYRRTLYYYLVGK